MSNAVERAKLLEAQGDYRGAAAAYLELGEIESAARVLMVGQRFRDAADLLIGHVSASGADLRSITGPLKRRAMLAANAYAKSGDLERASSLYRMMGEHVKAKEVLGGQLPSQPSAGPAANAPERARLLLDSGDPAGAGKVFLNAGMPYDAAHCFQQAGDLEKTLDALVRVPRTHPKYRRACVEAIEIAVERDALDFRLDEFLSTFLDVPPEDQVEAEAVYRLSWVYRNNDLPDSAREALEKVAIFDATYRDVAELLNDMNSAGRGSAMAFEKIVREDASFNRDRGVGARVASSLENRLSDLPPLSPHTMASAGGGRSAPAPVGSQAPNVPPQAHVLPQPPVAYAVTPQYVAPTRAEPLSPQGPYTGAAIAPGMAPHASPPRSEEPASLEVGSLPIGTVIDGRYELIREIGRGGMAAVYEAQDRELEERVAMKFFFGGDDAELLQRFKQELSLSRKLAHVNIIKVFDIGTYRGAKFISMELLIGKGLGHHMRRKLGTDVLLNLLIQTCAGLHAAHEAGVVHRDIKPDNIFVTEKGVVKVMDFGIAKQQAKPGLTRAGYMAGTPHYMAPEQIFSFGSVDRRADIYALGIMAYEMFCGKLPFQGDDMMQLLQMHLKETPPQPKSVVPDMPDGLDAAIMKCLAKKPEDRFDNCRSLAAALQAVRATLPKPPAA
ncbi:MAG TPA: protein kinase [Polyangiaceae bacterium]|nr:protein kinase [Polyangiaceae bacterium]